MLKRGGVLKTQRLGKTALGVYYSAPLEHPWCYKLWEFTLLGCHSPQGRRGEKSFVQGYWSTWFRKHSHQNYQMNFWVGQFFLWYESHPRKDRFIRIRREELKVASTQNNEWLWNMDSNKPGRKLLPVMMHLHCRGNESKDGAGPRSQPF